MARFAFVFFAGALFCAGRVSGFGFYEGGAAEAEMILVANTRGGNVVAYGLSDGAYLGQVLEAEDPDHLLVHEGSLYVSTGQHAVLKCGMPTVEAVAVSCSVFAEGGGLSRPYGFAFDDAGSLFVSSFLTDDILRYDATTGAFLDVFASGNATEEGLVNGPNHLFYEDGVLYATTQGSVAVNGSASFAFGLQSKILVFDLATGDGAVFAEDIAAIGPYVSLLGVQCKGDDLFVSDFAGGLRRYDKATATLTATYDTTFTDANHAIGSFDFAKGTENTLYAVGFVDDESIAWPGAVLTYDLTSTAASGVTDFNNDPATSLLVDETSPYLARPIGCVVL
eukprot:CAMPEP_0118910694 /NCGR_PEP_ID=MMETSP1166-20130328/12720_1 /TAXON_ID=1104430 /ORGANISM="Chrysoreinhardia sp, Strain CCMP3193" /LENGTH=336 /DNA_ID=CAMNT_0006850161 /DNA_START=15 /DNA_END=1025 /DNA_ORIENTATION=+